MSDLIDRQKAIDLWECYRPYIAVKASEYDMKLKMLPSVQAEQRWIPCNWQTKEENLPQECRSVLICVKYSYGYRIGESYRTDYNRWEGFGRANVIAWMPLPEPYQEEGDS